jgi:adenylate cyclase
MQRNNGPPAPKRLRFGSFLLDFERGSLLAGDSEVSLRPKTFAVLCFLTANRGRLVSKDELFDAVWPNIAVTDDALVQSVGELRRALGPEGARLIKTIPRRGYRFEAEVETAPEIPDQTPPSPVVSSAPAPALAVETNRKTGWRIRWISSIVVVCLAAVGLFWVGLGADWHFLDSPNKSKTGLEAEAQPAIAILPFANQVQGASQDYFADGLTQDLITALGRFSELTVLSWNAVLPFKGKTPTPEDVAGHLAVRYQVEGTVWRTGDSVRVTAQLVDRDGRVLWSDRFEQPVADIFDVQDRITTEIAETLAIRVTQTEQRRVSAKPTENLDAYDYVLRARPALLRPARAELAQSRVLLRQAITLDPNYAAAYSALAESFYVAVSMGWAESPTEFLSQAEQLANKALAIDNRDVRARILLGRIAIFYHRYEQALAEMDRAIALNPNDAHALAGRGNVLTWLGQTDAAIEALEQALRIDPELHPMDRFALGLAYYLKRRYDAAIEQEEHTVRETAGANFSRVLLAAAYAEDNQAEAAARTVDEIRRLDPTFDPQEFGTKFLNPSDLENLRAGIRKAGLFAEASPASSH